MLEIDLVNVTAAACDGKTDYLISFLERDKCSAGQGLVSTPIIAGGLGNADVFCKSGQAVIFAQIKTEP